MGVVKGGMHSVVIWKPWISDQPKGKSLLHTGNHGEAPLTAPIKDLCHENQK